MSEAKEESAEGGEHAEGGKGGGKKKLIIIIVAALVLIGGGAGAFLAMSGGKEAQKEEEEKPRVLKTLAMDTFITNLADSDRVVYLKLVMVLEYDEELIKKASDAIAAGGGGGGGHGGGAGGGAEKAGPPVIFETRMPMIKDALYGLLAVKQSSEIRTAEGKERLKEEILEAVNTALGLEEPAVVAVYFSEFIIQ